MVPLTTYTFKITIDPLTLEFKGPLYCAEDMGSKWSPTALHGLGQ